MARYCNWSTESPRFQRCRAIAEPGTYRCSEHQTKKVYKRSGDLTTAMKNAIRKRDNFECAVCGEYADEVDHVVELNEFGPDEKHLANRPSNLQLLCGKHHKDKTGAYRKSLIVEDDVHDTSTTARNRKKKRRRAQGFYYR